VPLSLRRRGRIYHARGAIRIGRETVHVSEFSTGCRSRADAEAVAAAEEARIRAERLEGPAGRARRLTIGECFAIYLSRPGGLKSYDLQRLNALNEAIGDKPLSEVAPAWSNWLQGQSHLAPGTAARYRTVLHAALSVGCKAHGVPLPEIPTVKEPVAERVVYLADDERERLLSAYNPHARRPVLVLAYQGFRTQEALRMDWRHADIAREQIRVPAERSKSGRGRTVPMHSRVREMLEEMWEVAGQPQSGPVFLSQRGVPYADTRGQGGNPLAQAHITACRVAGITGFRVHDWRHDWAARMVMAGVDLYTLMRLGGWSSLKMVERYASVSAEHMREAMSRLS
jgi:integrase